VYGANGAVVMDAADASYGGLLLEQATRHNATLSAFEGLVIDGLENTELYNVAGDDGASVVGCDCARVPVPVPVVALVPACVRV
jgi:hypothetical protein